MSDDPKFRIRFQRTKRMESRFIGGSYAEPVEAVEAAEAYMREYGMDGQSHAEIRFNGEKAPHYLVFRITPERYGLYNTDACKWPIFFIEGTDAFRDQLTEIPWEVPDDGTKNSQESEKEDYGPTQEDEKQDRPAEDGGSEDGEEDGDGGEEESDDDEGSDEGQPMRLTFFSRLRGPRGWRKKAETNPETEFQTFVWRVGIQDEEGREARKPLVNAVFRETDENRTAARLTLSLPPDAFIVSSDTGRMIFEIPTQTQE